MALAVGLAAPETLVRVFLDEGPAVARLARAAAESLGTEPGTSLSVALGSPPGPAAHPANPTAVLTDRELSVLRFLPSRLTYAEIARECLMSVNTVKTHLKSIYAKLGVTSRAETVERARLLGLFDDRQQAAPSGSCRVVRAGCDGEPSRPGIPDPGIGASVTRPTRPVTAGPPGRLKLFPASGHSAPCPGEARSPASELDSCHKAERATPARETRWRMHLA